MIWRTVIFQNVNSLSRLECRQRALLYSPSYSPSCLHSLNQNSQIPRNVLRMLWKQSFIFILIVMENVDSIKNDPVWLQPFIHQVGGHSSFQQFEQFTVCKPLFSKELEFYQEMPTALKPFIPKFKGKFTGAVRLSALTFVSVRFNLCLSLKLKWMDWGQDPLSKP